MTGSGFGWLFLNRRMNPSICGGRKVKEMRRDEREGKVVGGSKRRERIDLPSLKGEKDKGGKRFQLPTYS